MRGKRSLFVIILLGCLFVFSGTAFAHTVNNMILYTVPVAGYPQWDIYSAENRPILGISGLDGNLLNKPNTTINPLPFGIYYLYANNNNELNAYSSLSLQIPSNNGTNDYLLDATFSIDVNNTTNNGSFHLFPPTYLYPTDYQVYLGWAAGLADKVGPGQSIGQDGKNDYYFVLGIGQQPQPPSTVPLPGAALLLGSGLLGLVGWRRFRMS